MTSSNRSTQFINFNLSSMSASSSLSTSSMGSLTDQEYVALLKAELELGDNGDIHNVVFDKYYQPTYLFMKHAIENGSSHSQKEKILTSIKESRFYRLYYIAAFINPEMNKSVLTVQLERLRNINIYEAYSIYLLLFK